MCEMNKGEKWYAYCIRMLKEQPTSFVTFVAMAAVIYLYFDNQKMVEHQFEIQRQYLSEQTNAYIQSAESIKEMSVKIEELKNLVRDNRYYIQHMEKPPVLYGVTPSEGDKKK